MHPYDYVLCFSKKHKNNILHRIVCTLTKNYTGCPKKLSLLAKISSSM